MQSVQHAAHSNRDIRSARTVSRMHQYYAPSISNTVVFICSYVPSTAHTMYFTMMVDTITLRCMHKSSCHPHIDESCLFGLHLDGIQRSDVVATLWSVTQEANHIVQTRALPTVLVADRGDGASTVAVAGKTPTGIRNSKVVEAILAHKMRRRRSYTVYRYCRVYAVHSNVGGLQAQSSTSIRTYVRGYQR